MAEELPDWLAKMRDQQLEEETGPHEQIVGDAVGGLEGQVDVVQEQPAWTDVFQEQPGQADIPEEQPDQGDILDDLREQMVLAEEEFEPDEGSPLSRAFSGLAPWQRLVLTVLLFLDVALCGCMALVMAGRVGLSF